MATETRQQVDTFLDDLAAVFDEESTADGQPDPEALDELADRADELVAVTDLSELLAASGLSDEAEPPPSLPAAVASGGPENVATLRSLLIASKLSTADDQQAAERVVELRSLVETARGEPPVGPETVSDATEDEAASTSDAESDAAEATETEAEDDDASTAPIRELLQSQLNDMERVFEGIPDVEGLIDDLGEDEDDKENTETTDEDGSRDDEQSTRSRDGTRWRPGGGTQRTTHSTIPSAGRRDIGRRPGRFSSVRGSTVSKR